jgi:isoleucyl-tRNA synthetase
MEDEINKYWQANQIFIKSVNNRSDSSKYVFYDGPPFITGTPHYGSLLPSIAKDVVPRYQTMKGNKVERVWGWDCHGLPIETKVEKNLGIKNRRQIEEYGIQKFVDECYSYTRNTSAEWKWYIDKIGRWVDFDNSYKTMDQNYMESVMWVFKQMMDKGLVYEGVRVSLFCTRCGTPISNFEIAMDNSYAEMEDPGVTIKFPVLTPGKFQGTSILAWTTTPWTLPSNKALVLDPKETYVSVEVKKLDIELELAWLVESLPANFDKLKKVQITQAYLENYKDDKNLTIKDARIRKTDDEYTFTVKYFAGSEQETGQMLEKTEKITKERYIELIKQASKKVVKTRYYYPLENGLTAELDVYQNNLQGLNVVEVEFSNLKQLNAFQKPEWFGKEVTDCKGIYPVEIADKTLAEVQAINAEYVQPAHNFEEHLITDKVILAKKRVEAVLKGMDYQIIEEFAGQELLGLKYEPPFSFFPAQEHEHQVYSFEGMVTMDEGTGIVHSAPGFGEVDTEMGTANKIQIAMSINDEGKYTEICAPYTGMYIKDADPIITEDLRKSERLFKAERIKHRYPFCYRCATPLIQKAQPSWFVNIQSIKGNLQKNNDWINWVPDHLKNGRFKKGIEMAPDWGVSRTRFWATPMPIWQREEAGKVVERVVIGSRDQLRELATIPLTKITFVHHAESESGVANARLTAAGIEQTKALQTRLQDIVFDEIYSSDTERAKETVSEIALAKNATLKIDDALGSLADSEVFKKIWDRVCQENNVTNASEASEDVLKAEFAEYISVSKSKLDSFLQANIGKNVLAASHFGRMAMLKHIYEGKTLKECFAMSPGYAKENIMFFNGAALLDLHRPKIDDIKLKGQTGELTRVKEVLDVWMDSASMPYASKHYPFENKAEFEANYPADYIVEYIAQTRAWFYVMHVISTALFDKPSFKNVVTTGVIFGTDGRKMSKSYGNYPDPKDTILKYGAEPLRLYFMGSKIMVGEDINFDEDALKEQIKTIILPLWNSYSFLITYANMKNWQPREELVRNNRQDPANKTQWNHIPFETISNKIDQWIIAKLQLTIRDFRTGMDEYNIPSAVKVIPAFIDDLSKWFIRRSRDRFANNEQAAYDTLYYVIVELAKLMAPITPFLSEALYQNLVKEALPEQLESVHLCDLPEYDMNFLDQSSDILAQMDAVRDIVTLGQSIRVQNALKVRQPLAALYVKINEQAGQDNEIKPWMKDLIMEELNIKAVYESTEPIEDTGWIKGENPEKNLVITIDTNLTDEMKWEGTIRELIRGIQNLRKSQNLQIGDQISLVLETEDDFTLLAIENNIETLKTGISAKEFTFKKGKAEGYEEIDVNKIKVYVKLTV